MIRHFAAATLFFSSDCFLLWSSGAASCLLVVATFRLDLRLRPAVVVLAGVVAVVFASLIRVLPRVRGSAGRDFGDNFSSLEAALAEGLDLGGVI